MLVQFIPLYCVLGGGALAAAAGAIFMSHRLIARTAAVRVVRPASPEPPAA